MFRRFLLCIVCLFSLVASCLAATIAPPTNFEQALGPAVAQPIVVYARDSVTPCFADYVPTPAEASGQFHVEMASNEYEPLQVGLYVPAGADPATRVRIELDIDIPYQIAYLFYGWPGSENKAKWRPADTGKWYKRYPGGRMAMPRYVIAGDTIDRITPGASAAFWITFQTNDDMSSGTHRGSIKVIAQGADVIEQPLTVHVRSFALPRPDIVFSLYYRPDRIPVYWQPQYQQLYINDMAAHGMTSCQIVSFFPSFGTDDYRNKGRVSSTGHGHLPHMYPWRTLLDPSEYADGLIDPGRMVEEQMKMLRSAGMLQGDMPIWTVQESVEIPQKAVVAQTMRRFSIDHDWPEIILQTRDEPPPWSTGPGQISPEMARAMLDFKKLKNCRTFTALSMASTFAWGHLHDVWVVFGGHITPEMIREAHRQGSQIWTYSERLRYTNALINRYYAGIYTWALGLEGNTPYAYHHHLIQPPFGKPAKHPVWLADRRRPSHDNIHAYVLPGPDGPIPGIGWEGRREGVDDYRHLQLLETRIAAAGRSNAVAREAAQWLEVLRRRIEVASVQGEGIFGAGSKYLWELDWVDPAPNLGAAAYSVIRTTAASYIERLAATEGERNPLPAKTEFPQIGWEGEPFDEATIATCVAAIESGSVRERRAAIAALTVKFADGADTDESSVKAIVSALDDPEIRVPALRAIRYLGPAAAAAATAVKNQLQAEDPFIRCGALLALGAMSRDGVDGLVAGLGDPFSSNSSLVAECLQRMGQEATPALDALEAALVATSIPSVRRSIAEAIKEIRGTEAQP